MGGTDDPHNLIELTVAEHAEAHRKLYEEHGKKEDYLAWKGLSGEIGKEQIIHEMRKAGGLKGANSEKNPWKNPEWHKQNNPRFDSEYQSRVGKLANTGEALEKKKKTFSKIKHQQGEKNSMYGKRWIHSLTEKRSTTIDKGDPLPEGWLEGRKMKFVDA
jgi:hypothetical protein